MKVLAVHLQFVPQYASHLYRSTPPICTGNTFEKIPVVGGSGKVLEHVLTVLFFGFQVLLVPCSRATSRSLRAPCSWTSILLHSPFKHILGSAAPSFPPPVQNRHAQQIMFLRHKGACTKTRAPGVSKLPLGTNTLPNYFAKDFGKVTFAMQLPKIIRLE